MRWLAIVLTTLVAGALPVVAELRAPLEASIRFLDHDGAEMDRIAPGQAFTIDLTLTSAAGAPWPRDLQPMAWLRPAEAEALPCGESAAAYRAAGAAPTGSIDLNRPLLGVVTEDDALTIVDPRMNLGSANILAAERLPGRPAQLVADPQRGRFLLILREHLWVQPVIGAGGEQNLPVPDAMSLAVTRTGMVAVGPAGAVLPDGTRRADARAIVTGSDGAMALLLEDRVEVVGPDLRTEVILPAADAVDVAIGEQAVLWVGLGALHLSWRDAPQTAPARIALPPEVTQIALAPSGRYVLAHGPQVQGAVLIDLARGRAIQQIGAHAPVAEIAFVDDTAYLRLADQSAIGILDLRLAGGDQPAPVAQIALGDPQPPEDPAAPRTLLVPLPKDRAILAVHTGNGTAFMLDRSQATTGKPPMMAIQLRGGVPRMVAALDRGLRESAPGRFRAVAALPQPGPFELVLSTGLGQAAFCALLPTVPPDPASLPPEPGRLTAIAATASDDMRLRLVDAENRPLIRAGGRLTLSALTGNWRGTTEFITDGEGMIPSFRVPDMRPLVIFADLEDQPVAPLLLEDVP